MGHTHKTSITMSSIVFYRVFLGGFMVAFYLTHVYKFILKHNQATQRKARTIYLLSSIAMGWNSALCLISFLFFVTRTVPFGLPGTDFPLYQCQTLNLLNMMVVPIIGTIVQGIACSKYATMRLLFVVQAPIAVALVFFPLFRTPIIYYALIAYIIIYVGLVIANTQRYIGRYQSILNDTYSNTAWRDIRWVHWFLWLTILQFGSWMLFDFIFSNHFSVTVHYLTSLVFWTLFAIFVRQQNFSLDDEMMQLINKSEEPDPTPAAEEKVNTDEELEWLSTRIEDYCKEKQHFLDPDLTVNDVTRAIGTNRTYLAKWFKLHGANFNSYINNLRAEYAATLLIQSNESITDIWTKSGFGTAYSFRSVFKEKYGCTASEYRTSHTTETE